jgi:CHAT domain-containing protein
MAEKIKILFLAANPSDMSWTRLDREAKQIKEILKGAKDRDLFEFITEFAVGTKDLQRVLLEHQPHIVHFSGHGSKTKGIALEDVTGNSQMVIGEALAEMFRVLRGNVRVVVLNACYTKPQAEAISKVIDFTIGMSNTIRDDAAIVFSASFYEALAFGKSIQDAFELGKNRIALEGIKGKDVPVVLVRDGANPTEPLVIGGKKGDSRRIDATVQTHASVGEHFYILVQVRFPDSPFLGSDDSDWPKHRKPDSTEPASTEVGLQFPVDRLTGKVSSAHLDIQLIAPDFDIRGAARKSMAVPLDRYSPILKFLITAKKAGVCKIDLEAYTAEQSYLGNIPLETTIDGEITTDRVKIASLTVTIIVLSEDPQKPDDRSGNGGGSSDTPDQAKRPRMYQVLQVPIWILNQAIQAVPAVKFALGIAGIAAAIAIIKTLVTDLSVAVFGSVVMIFLMSTLFLFAQATRIASKQLKHVLLVFIWAGLLLFTGTGFALFGSVFFKWPVDLQYLLRASSTDTIQYPGRVIDAYTMKGIADAKVSVESEGGSQTVLTDSMGSFLLKLKASARNAHLRVVAPGYQTVDQNIDVSKTGIADVRLKLAPPSREEIKEQVRSSYPPGANIEIDLLGEPECTEGCKVNVKVVLSDTNGVKKDEYLSVTCRLVNGQWHCESKPLS